MICFRDMTFCSGPDHSSECDRRWTAELMSAAEEWWGGPDAPVAFAPLCSVATAGRYVFEKGRVFTSAENAFLNPGGNMDKLYSKREYRNPPRFK